MWIDSHCHMDNALLSQDSENVIKESIFEGVDQIIIPAVSKNNFDKVIGIVSDVKLRHSRLLSRGMSSSSIKNIINNQVTDALIVKLSDFIIYNNVNADLINDVNKIHLEILNH